MQFVRIELFTNNDMAIFAYTARETATGREIRNTVEALTEQAFVQQFKLLLDRVAIAR